MNRLRTDPLAPPAAPALVIGQVHHMRHRPIRHGFTTRHHTWLIDLASPPRLPRWARHISFDARDHLAGSADWAELGSNVRRCVAREGLPAETIDRILMLAHPRVLGHTFNPLTGYWCLAGDTVIALVLEVHNTYGGRHAYVFTADEARSGALLSKAFHVSPFNRVDGIYQVRITSNRNQIAIRIRLVIDQTPVLTASVGGRVVPVTPRTLFTTLLRDPFMPQRVSLQIRIHGVWLWLRRLPIQERPIDDFRSVR